MSETCRVLYQINLRNSASHWLSLEEYITMHGLLNVKDINYVQTGLQLRSSKFYNSYEPYTYSNTVNKIPSLHLHLHLQLLD